MELKPDKVFFRIIVPNYNNYVYIKKCLESISQQTFQNFVCIVSDDYSTDDSPKIAEIFQKRFPGKFYMVRPKQKGYAGAARNAGLDFPIESEYTYFIDSDDWLFDNTVFQRLRDNIIRNNFPDVVRCTFVEMGSLLKIHTGFFKHIATTNIDDIMRLGAGPSKNCFRSKFDVRFIEDRAKNNDMVWFLRLYDRVDIKKISAERYPIYVYNRLSLTSCQNNISMVLNRECTRAERLCIEDMKKEELFKPYTRAFRDKIVGDRLVWYKDEITIKDFFKNSFMITIDDDKFNKTKKLFQDYFDGLSPQKVIGSQEKNLTGPQNCTRSHIKIVKNAKIKNLPFVVIFEDDAYPRKDVKERLAEYLYRIPYNVNMVLLGWSNHQKKLPQKFDLPFNKITSLICGSHSYILFKDGYDMYLDYMRRNVKATADCHIYNNVYNSCVIDKPLFIQYSESKSMNGHIGYIFYGDHDKPPEGFVEFH